MIAKMGIWWWKPWFWELWWWKRMMVRRRMVMEGKEVISSALLAKNIYNSFHLYCTIGKQNKREKWSTLRNVYLLSVYSQWIFIWFFLTIHTRLHQPNPNPKSSKVKQMLNILTNIANSSTVLELNCTWNDWLTWTSSWRCYWRKARTPRLRLVLYVQLQLSQWLPPFESLPTAAIIIVADIPHNSVSPCLSSFV